MSTTSSFCYHSSCSWACVPTALFAEHIIILIKKNRRSQPNCKQKRKSMPFALIWSVRFHPKTLVSQFIHKHFRLFVYINIATHLTKGAFVNAKNSTSFSSVEYYASRFCYHLTNLITFYLSMGIRKCGTRISKAQRKTPANKWNNNDAIWQNLRRNRVLR